MSSTGPDPVLTAAQSLVAEGNRRFRAEDYQSAFEHYSKAIQIDDAVYNWTLSAYRNLAWCLIKLGDRDRAKVLLRECRSQFPEYTDLLYIESLIALDQGEWELAIRLFGECIDAGEPPDGYISWPGVGSWRAQEGLHLALIGNTEGIHPGDVFQPLAAEPVGEGEGGHGG